MSEMNNKHNTSFEGSNVFVKNMNLILNTKKMTDMIYSENKSFPVQAELYLTDKCNLECTGCKCSGSKTSLNGRRLLQVIEEFHQAGVKTIILKSCPGEPSLHKDFNKIIKKIKSLNMFLGMQTNGVRAKYRNITQYFDFITIKMDCFSEEKFKIKKGKNRLNAIKENILELNSGKVMLDCFINKDNEFRDVWSFLDEIKNSKISVIRFNDFLTGDAGDNEYRCNWLKQIQVDFQTNFQIVVNSGLKATGNFGVPCYANSLITVLLSNGHYAFCQGLLKNKSGVKCDIGDYNDSFINVWNNTEPRELLKSWCESGKWCSATCPERSLTVYNEFINMLNRVKGSRLYQFY